jgi:hypothetical protein
MTTADATYDGGKLTILCTGQRPITVSDQKRIDALVRKVSTTDWASKKNFVAAPGTAPPHVRVEISGHVYEYDTSTDDLDPELRDLCSSYH